MKESPDCYRCVRCDQTFEAAHQDRARAAAGVVFRYLALALICLLPAIAAWVLGLSPALRVASLVVGFLYFPASSSPRSPRRRG
jgi:hypothetical protein